jgi:hypothetical protein
LKFLRSELIALFGGSGGGLGWSGAASHGAARGGEQATGEAGRGHGGARRGRGGARRGRCQEARAATGAALGLRKQERDRNPNS